MEPDYPESVSLKPARGPRPFGQTSDTQQGPSIRVFRIENLDADQISILAVHLHHGLHPVRAADRVNFRSISIVTRSHVAFPATFDRRLHRAGLRLQVNQSGSLELELSGEGTAPAHLAVDAVPRVPGDLPPGPFRSRIAALTDVRALMPHESGPDTPAMAIITPNPADS